MGHVHQPNHAGRGKNPELRTIFYRLAQLVKVPFAAVFVFDGPGRPSEKRGKAVSSMTHWLVPDVWKLVEAFGFHCHQVRSRSIHISRPALIEAPQAPGEAEAELARLNCEGIIDAVLTDDVDAMVFGANTVLRKCAVFLICILAVLILADPASPRNAVM
jgi:Holliday junction resolvase YEN1